MNEMKAWRNSEQFLLPIQKADNKAGRYDIYPGHVMEDDKISIGFDCLYEKINKHSLVLIDGYQGVFFREYADELQKRYLRDQVEIDIIFSEEFLKLPGEIDELIAPFLGGDDPIFGKKAELILYDFFQEKLIEEFKKSLPKNKTIIIGPGAALFEDKESLLCYIDLPKNELQFRARAGSIHNIGAEEAYAHKMMYKRFYFIDWVVLNKHKKETLPLVDLYIDGQQKENTVFTEGDDLRKALEEMAVNVFRVRPWFEPGAWGGQWIKDKIPGLNKDVPNYAWSFELIVPENGLLLQSGEQLMEVSFDCLMYQSAPAVLGKAYERFKDEFPIRFDFLDTMDGGNLSVQCHPRPEYIKKEFGEHFTQEECYYILDTKNEASVYLGFQENMNPSEFEKDLKNSFSTGEKVDIEKHVMKHPAKKHDLFLIPYGTIHGSGCNNMVLEISSTPYIFTFKMYDWLRMDLDGKPRPLNIKRGMDNLYFDRKGQKVKDELLTEPKCIEQGGDWSIYHLKTHDSHFYDVHRIHLKTRVKIDTHNVCHVLSLVEGDRICLVTKNGMRRYFNYAETFVVPAGAESYVIENESNREIMLIKAFVK